MNATTQKFLDTALELIALAVSAGGDAVEIVADVNKVRAVITGVIVATQADLDDVTARSKALLADINDTTRDDPPSGLTMG